MDGRLSFMRHSETISLSKRKTAIVSELRVGDVRAMLLQPQDAAMHDTLQRCLSVDINKLLAADIERVNAVFMRINTSFYSGADRAPAKGDTVKRLDITCCHLIEHGHVNVFDYGWRFFLTCTELHQK